MAAATDYPEMYVDLGIDTGEMGCIMIDVEPIVVSDVIPADALWYKSDAPESHTQGNVSETVPHVTLLYGLMSSGPALQKHVDTVLTGYKVDELNISEVSFFYGDYEGQPYITIIALVEVTPELLDGLARLRLLPHIDTFADFKPHITLAYVKDTSDWQDYVHQLNKTYGGTSVKTTGINYGD